MTNYELYVDTIKTLAPSQGIYSRMLRDFNEMSDTEKKRIKSELNALRPIEGTVEMCMFLEGSIDIRPEKKYGKKILSERSMEVNGDEYTCFVLDNNDYYDIHIVDDHYADDELNTLKLQEPKDSVSLEKVTSKAFMLSEIMEHVLWHICYGDNNKHYDFDITYEETEL